MGCSDLDESEIFNAEYASMTKEEVKTNPRDSVPRLNENGVNLLIEMLVMDPADRINARQALKHPYFDGRDVNEVPCEIVAVYEE